MQPLLWQLPLPPPQQLPPTQQLLLQHGSQLGLAADQLPSARHARTTVGSAASVPAPRPWSQLTVAVVRRSGSALYTLHTTYATQHTTYSTQHATHHKPS
jgi:hypothetical protein